MPTCVMGASGFVGNALVRHLAEAGETVHALVRPTSSRVGLDHPRVRVMLGDLGDPASLRPAMAGCERVFHTAALVRIGGHAPAEFEAANVVGTRNVLVAAHEVGVGRIVYTSSAIVLGPTDGTAADETWPRAPGPYLLEYQRSKVRAEAEAERLAAAGLPVVIALPALFFGPQADFARSSHTQVLNRAILDFWRDRLVGARGAERRRINAAHIDDVVAGLCLAAEHGRAGERYLLTGENVTIGGFLEALSAVAGLRRRPRLLPFRLVQAAAALEETRARLSRGEPDLTPGSVAMLRHDWAYASAKARRDLGFAPRPLAEGLGRMWSWVTRTLGPPRP